MRCVVIDGYVDEPAVLGVPPYVSTYVRYLAGALLLRGHQVDYLTIDQVRKSNLWHALGAYDVIAVVGGVTVPGRYTGGTPINPYEVKKIFNSHPHAHRIIVGTIGKAFAGHGGALAKATGDDLEFDEYIDNIPLWHDPRNYLASLREISLAGATIVPQHPRFPNVICEIEVSLGCERKTFCTFCTEPLIHPKFFSRPVADVVDEVAELYRHGVRAFRLGRSANILAYGSDFNAGYPNPLAIEELYRGIRERCPSLLVLHTDNANPAYLSRYRDRAARIVETIATYNTAGDVLSFGVESFDEAVRRKNNIDGTVDDIDFAVRLVNEIGGARDENGVPRLLPGVNLIFGLYGETSDTYRLNYEKLLQYLGEGLFLRRINIRQLLVFPGTPIHHLSKRKTLKVNKRAFEHYKYLIRTNVDNPMLKRVFPVGTVIQRVLPEFREGKLTFARPLGTYPILVGVPAEFDEPVDVVVVGHGHRSVTAVRKVPLTSLTHEELELIPGIGKRNVYRVRRGDFSTLPRETLEFVEKYFLKSGHVVL